MIKGKTKTGFEFELDERIGTDWRIVSNIALAESDDMSDKVKGASALVSLLCGNNEKKLMKHIADNNDGFVPMPAVMNELRDMIQGSNELKN